MKDVILFLAAVILCFVFIPKLVLAAQEERIGNFTSQISINKDGTIDVTERIDYYFPDYRHGIYREILKVKINDENKRFLLSFTNISVKDPQGVAYKFSDDSTKDKLYLKIGDPNKTIIGLHTYVISYKVSGALTYFDDTDELYWNVTGNQWPVPIKEISVKVVLPEESKPQSFCYTGAIGSTAQNCTVTNQDNYSSIKASNLNVGEGVTSATVFDKGIVAVLEPKPNVPSVFEQIKIFLLGLLIVVAVFLWFVFLPIRIFITWRRDKKFTKKNEKIVAAWFDPPKNEDGSLYTAAETGALIDKSVDFRDITASIIQLAQKGHIKIHVDEKKNFSFEKLKEFTGDPTIKESERAILSGIFSGSENTVTAKSLKTSTKFAKSITDFKESLSNELARRKLFEKDFSKVSVNNTVLATFALMTGNLILALVAFILGRKSAKRTVLGVEKYSEAKSLENFLKSQDTQLDYQARNQMFFERLLPYATAFGVEAVWAKRFSDLQFTQPEWYDGNINNALLFAALSSNISGTINSSVSYSSRSSSSGFSSGGGGGGFSGGGGCGGGGGSW